MASPFGSQNPLNSTTPKKKKPEELNQPKQNTFIPTPTPVPPPQGTQFSEFNPIEGSHNVLQTTKGSGGSIFIKELKPSELQQIGQINPKMGFTPEQQAIIDQQAQFNQAQATEALRGQIGNITPEQQLAAEQGNTIQGGVGTNVLADVATNILSKGATGAATGAIAGGIGGEGVGAIPGGLIGGAGGIIYGAATVIPELKSQAIQNTRVQKASFTTSKSNIKAIIDGVNHHDISALEAVELYNRELAKIDRAEGNLKMLSENDWAKAKDELIAIQQFNSVERARSMAILEQAILQPNPAATLEFSPTLSDEVQQ